MLSQTSAKLQASGVTILDLANAIGAANIIDSPGLYEENHQLVLALVGSQAHGLDDLKQLTVKSTTSGAPVRVSDVADVVQAAVPAYTYVSANGKPAVLLEHHTAALKQHSRCRGWSRCRSGATAHKTPGGRYLRTLL